MLKLEGTGKAVGLLDCNEIVAVPMAFALSPKLNFADCPPVTELGEIVNVDSVGPEEVVVKLEGSPMLVPPLFEATA